MGGNFLEFMKSMGIFILCAQSLMHFTAGKAYEKYVKLLIGIMILAQFTVQARAVFFGMENAQIWEEVERFQRELEAVAREAEASFGQGLGRTGAGAGTGIGEPEGKRDGMDGAIGGTAIETGGWEKEKSALEEDVKERLEGTAASYGMTVEKVEIKEELPKIAVTVSRGAGGMGMELAEESEEEGEVIGGEMPMGEGMPADKQMLAGEEDEGEKGAAGKIRIEKITIGGGKGQDAASRQEDGTGDLQGLAESFSKAHGTYADYIEVIVSSSEMGYRALGGRAEVKYGNGKT